MASFVYNPKMIQLARESRGLTQIELCRLMNVAQGTVSKLENEDIYFSDEYAFKLSEILNYPLSFFSQKDDIYPISMIYYRKKAKIPGKIQSKFEATINILRINIERLLKRVELVEPNLINWDVEKNGSPEHAAMYLREVWKVPKGRIENLTELIEDNGIFVIQVDFGTEAIDGVSLFTSKGQPVIFVNSGFSADRQRLTVAHELGHLILHFTKLPDNFRDLEKEAFRFANEFLFPEIEFRRSFAKLNLKVLANMKRYWKVSMASMIMRAHNLEMLTSNEEKYLWQQMVPFRTREPEELDFPKEQPTLLKEVIEIHKNEFNFTNEDLSILLSLSSDDYRTYYEFEGRKLFRVA
ncbi:ImmA/IrrE family metallo-endopeptidase [Runella sp. CRIBMP]|uniref:XRE family transcriptional regulator n=1 Tax=Runella sp. CRIBMP TaxID=2683261 RepID=UPI0014132097|nr:XRE family transcriptional regulator [Runella sp. CRIBMP]NBB18823.1 ImmA/IrrE family metallo-endopeptidase [Runella sp. CRIBMP]